MQIELKNIGAIGEMIVEIEGITIIAGENNVGKSTVGKALYAFLREMHNWKNLYNDTCEMKIKDFLYKNSVTIEDWCMSKFEAKRRRTSKADSLQRIYAANVDFHVAFEDYQIDEKECENICEYEIYKYLEEYCASYISLYSKVNIGRIKEEHSDFIRNWIGKTLENVQTIELDEIKLQTNIIQQSLKDVFNSQYKRIGTQESIIIFKDEDRTVKYTIKDDIHTLDQPIRISNQIYFIESPKIYDYLSETKFGQVQKKYMRYLMSPNIFRKGTSGFRGNTKFISLNSEEMLDVPDDVSDELVTAMGGQAEFLQKVGLVFKDKKLSEPIQSINVSTGLKSLALLEYALRIGAIQKGDILILDEPEINLHPEWQLIYAKVLVLLQKNFNLKFVITSHSPYFMRAIECYSDINDIMDKLNVYRVIKDENGVAEAVNVSYSEFGMTDLYEDLSAPLEELDELLENR